MGALSRTRATTLKQVSLTDGSIRDGEKACEREGFMSYAKGVTRAVVILSQVPDNLLPAYTADCLILAQTSGHGLVAAHGDKSSVIVRSHSTNAVMHHLTRLPTSISFDQSALLALNFVEERLELAKHWTEALIFKMRLPHPTRQTTLDRAFHRVTSIEKDDGSIVVPVSYCSPN